ncbi:MAG: Holliday junction resolvase RuvX [Bacteroidetes bacterium]|nr:Holliday junction resolvase RuvX [Bacteroidota bacterium]MCB0844731.1 Holliday junction resolvase RuvX [Bacteroidota bacterium]
MPRIIAIDYGKKRTGLAWTDPLKMIATGIGSFDTAILDEKLKSLIDKEEIEAIVLGYPTRLDGTDSHVTEEVRTLKENLEKQYPQIRIHLWDERLTSKMAFQAMIDGGLKKKKRRDKHLVNEISAVIILQEFLQQL